MPLYKKNILVYCNVGGIMAEEVTIFDKIIQGEAEADVVYDDEVAIAFKDIAPVAAHHVLVVPKKKIASMAEAGMHEPVYLGRFLQVISRVAEQLGLNENGYRVVINHGRDAQQSVPYLHAHIIAGRPLMWPPG